MARLERGVGGSIFRAPTVSVLAAMAAARVVVTALEAIRDRGVFTIALPGGTTPRKVFALLADDHRLRSQIDWEKVIFFWGDERHVPPDHLHSNFRMARASLLDRVPIDPTHVWRIKGEYPNAADAASEYERDLRNVFGLSQDDVPRLDLVMLGMGPDGHTASLFPGTPALHEQRRLVVSNRSEKLKTDRITMTARLFNNARHVLFVVHGADKAAAVKAVLEGPFLPDQFPAQLVQPREGSLVWLLNSTAARLLTSVGDVD
jgi:6-phosphogluconolactonase